LEAGLCLDLLGELKHSPDPLAAIEGGRERKGRGGKGKGRKERRKGRGGGREEREGKDVAP